MTPQTLPPIGTGTLGHQLLWLLNHPEGQGAPLAKLLLMAGPVPFDQTEQALRELILRGEIRADGAAHHLTGHGQVALATLGVWPGWQPAPDAPELPYLEVPDSTCPEAHLCPVNTLADGIRAVDAGGGHS
ncbi:hypothetical protein [Deinococcus multiflagellatus]|uniref:hypothetical protein n=1 Tax=Deinococcus multiflagellatus TaxID=1656887 RepID=UPI001CCDFED4|nr:hypothetical protein [Deinococcus multiflagellatus]MBZ9715363.1 hypothetical protein [Deinococcus multiflagellatus]